MYTIRVYYNPTCTVCQSAEKSCKCHYFQPVFKQRNISFICGLHYSAFEYPRRQKKSANGTLVWRRERDSNPCEIALKRFSRPPRYDHFDIPPYKRNYEIVLEKTLEEKTLLSEKCACSSQIQGFFADCFRYGKEVSRPPRYDRFDIPPYLTLILYHKLFFLSTPFCYFLLLLFFFPTSVFFRFTKDLHAQNLGVVVGTAKICYNVLAKQKKE